MSSQFFSNNQIEVYSDLTPDLDIHPVKKDLVRFVDEAAVKRSIRNLLYTRKTSRFFDVNKGAGILQYLFEPMTDITSVGLQNEIKEVINNYESRVSLVDVIVNPNYDDQSYDIDIIFFLLNRTTPLTISLSLERVR